MDEDEAEGQEPQPKADALTKVSEEGFFGGMPIDLERTLEGHSHTLREELSVFLKKTLELELANQQDRIDKIGTWEEQYYGKHDETDFPFEGAAALSPPITLVNIDAIFVRIWDALWSKRKLWLLTPKKPEYKDAAMMLEDFLDWFHKNIVHLKEKFFSPLMQSLQSGTGLGKIVYQRNVRTTYRIATEEETKDKEITTYPIWNSENKCVKIVESTYNGPNFIPVPRENFVVSSDATSLEDAFLIAHRTLARRPQIEHRESMGYYLPGTLSRIRKLETPAETEKRRAANQFVELEYSEDTKPYELWEAQFSYDVDGDGEEDEIVATIHLDSGTLARAIYQPLFSSYRPFVKLTPVPVPYRFDGRGFCEALEPIQNEIDYFHNQRINRLIEINAPMTVVKAGIGLDSFELNPGRTVFTDYDIEKSIKFLTFPDVYPSTEREEDRLIDLARQLCGITQAVLGESTAERPVAKETFARIQEANRKFGNMIDNCRGTLIELGYKFLEFFAQFQPVYTWKEPGDIEERTVEFPADLVRQSFEVTLEVSTEVMNMEVRREINLTIYQLLSDYMTKLATMMQVLVNPKAPPDFKKTVVEANRISVEVIKKILKDYEIPDPETYVLDLSKTVDTEALINQQPAPEEQPQPGMENQEEMGVEMPPGMPQQEII